MRVFVGPLEVSGIGHGLVQGLRAVGVDAELVCGQLHPFAYSETISVAWPVRAWMQLGHWRATLPRRRRLAKATAVLLHGLASWLVLAWAAARFDGFVFLYGRTITNTAQELRILRLLGKRTIVAFLGSDARPAYLDGATFPADRDFDAVAASATTRCQRRQVQRLERHASAVVTARTTAQFLRRPFVNWFAIGIPRAAQLSPPPSMTGAVRVLHSPSHPVLKGTAEVHAAINRMQARGIAVELITITGRPNSEVRQALRECHLVVDQIYSDTPMAAFATEAASLGRPVVVCGYAADRVVAQVSPLLVPPTVYVVPESFEVTLEALVLDAARRQAVGQACQAFVDVNWSPAAVAARLLRVLHGDIPPQWWCQPSEVDYVVGCGLPESVARERVAAVIRQGGVAALQVAHNPALERAFVDFSEAAQP